MTKLSMVMLGLQVTVQSLSVKSAGQTLSDGLWGLDRVDQKPRKRDYMYHYSYTGSGVHVYTVDTVCVSAPSIICEAPAHQQLATSKCKRSDNLRSGHLEVIVPTCTTVLTLLLKLASTLLTKCLLLCRTVVL